MLFFILIFCLFFNSSRPNFDALLGLEKQHGSLLGGPRSNDRRHDRSRDSSGSIDFNDFGVE
jgi:hypothetical protein